MIFFILPLIIIIGFVGYKLISSYKLVRHYEQVVIPSAIAKYLSNDFKDPIPLNRIKNGASSQVDGRAVDICLRFLKSQQNYQEITPFQHQATFVFMLRKVLVTFNIVPNVLIRDYQGDDDAICLSATFLEDQNLDSRITEITKYLSKLRWGSRNNPGSCINLLHYPPDGIHEILINEYLTNKEFAQFYGLCTSDYTFEDELPLFYQKFATMGDIDEYALIIKSGYLDTSGSFPHYYSTSVSIFKINESALNEYPFLKNTPLQALYAN